MCAQQKNLKFGVILAVLGLVLTAPMVVDAAEKDEAELNIKARAVSVMNIARAASDLIDIRITRWSTEDERTELVRTLETQGNPALAAALNESEETGWIRFDPRGGGGPGRDPRKTTLRYAREIVRENTREIILITNHYIGYGTDPQAADGAKLSGFPVSFVLLKFQKDDKGSWKGIGRIFVGARVRFDSAGGKFIIDEFPMDPVYLKDVTIK
jgi:hypothetical protein